MVVLDIQLTFAVTPRYDWSKTSEVGLFNLFYVPRVWKSI